MFLFSKEELEYCRTLLSVIFKVDIVEDRWIILSLYFWFIEIRELIIIKKRGSCYGGAIHTATSFFLINQISFCLSTFIIIEAKNTLLFPVVIHNPTHPQDKIYCDHTFKKYPSQYMIRIQNKKSSSNESLYFNSFPLWCKFKGKAGLVGSNTTT